MTRNKKKLRRQEKIKAIPKATQIVLLAGLLLNGQWSVLGLWLVVWSDRGLR